MVGSLRSQSSLAALPPLSSAWSPLCVRKAHLRCFLLHWAHRRLLQPLAAPPLSPSLGLLRPVSRTARGLRAPHQFPLKSCGFSGAETARKRFLLWKMGFSDTAYCELLHPSIQHGRPLRSQARLRHSLLHWAYYGLFRSTIRNSRLATLPLASLLCSLDFRFACSAHCARRSSVPLAAAFVRPRRTRRRGRLKREGVSGSFALSLEFLPS